MSAAETVEHPDDNYAHEIDRGRRELSKRLDFVIHAITKAKAAYGELVELYDSELVEGYSGDAFTQLIDETLRDAVACRAIVAAAR